MASPAAAEQPSDWPQFRGPERNGVSRETGLLKVWPAAGPEVLWRAPAGEGSAGLAIADGRIFTMVARDDLELAISLEVATGDQRWQVPLGEIFTNPEGNGPRSTPTVDDDRVYVASARGKLYGLAAEDGAILWHRDLVAKFGAEIPYYGFAVSPLVDGRNLFINGGGEGSALIAFDKLSGEVVWKTESDKPAYASPILVEQDRWRQLLFMTHERLLSASPSTGEIYWSFPWTASAYYNNIATPIALPEDRIFISTGYGVGSALLELTPEDGKPQARQVWRKNVLRTHFHSSVYWQGFLYGFDNFLLKCVDASRGQTRWAARGFGEGSLIVADGHLIVYGQRGKLALIEATPEEYREKASVQLLDGRCYANPALAAGRLYLRNEEEIVSLNIKARLEQSDAK